MENFTGIYDANEKSVGDKADTALEGDSSQAESVSPNALLLSIVVGVLATGREIPLKVKRALDIWPPMSNVKVAI
jgi:hypothetical protein